MTTFNQLSGEYRLSKKFSQYFGTSTIFGRFTAGRKGVNVAKVKDSPYRLRTTLQDG